MPDPATPPPAPRHRWFRVNPHKAHCARCGWVRLHIPAYNRHVTQFERTGVFADRTPPCDGAWPAGWSPEGFDRPEAVALRASLAPAGGWPATG